MPSIDGEAAADGVAEARLDADGGVEGPAPPQAAATMIGIASATTRAGEIGARAMQILPRYAIAPADPAMTWPVLPGTLPRVTAVPDLEFHPLTPDRLPDLASLFEQGGDPKWCWCAYFRVRSVDFSSASKPRHRGILENAAEEGVRVGRAPGLVAYRGAEAVGWVSLGPREDYERLVHSRILAPIDDAPVWSIVCFVVGRTARGQGVARRLLDAGIEYARTHGASILEAYPVEIPEGARIPSADAYRGTLSMFEDAGFRVVARRQAPGSKGHRPIVRLDLTGA